MTLGSVRLRLNADALNVTNSDADQSFQNGGNQLFSVFYGQGANRQLPRALELSIGLEFGR
jgi:hypothetical protein